MYVEMYKSSRDRDRKGSNIQKDKRYTDLEGSCPKWHLGFFIRSKDIGVGMYMKIII